eukprot:763356-Hanusia_phi.AAC.1
MTLPQKENFDVTAEKLGGGPPIGEEARNADFPADSAARMSAGCKHDLIILHHKSCKESGRTYNIFLQTRTCRCTSSSTSARGDLELL